MAWASIQYRDFYDIPRAFVAEREGHQYLFDCRFDERIDDYPNSYRVYRLAPILPEALTSASWEPLEADATFLGDIPIDVVLFDPSKRKAVDDSVFQFIERLPK